VTPVLLLLLAIQGQDPVQLRARLLDEEIHAGETTVLRVDVETTGERAQIPRFRSLPPGLELAGTRDSDQRQFSIPGGTRRFITREFTLRARAPGRYRIPSLDVVVDGRSYTTTSLILSVIASPDRRLPGSVDGVVLRTWLDADTVYVGEQVTLQAEAMFSQDIRFRLRRAPEYEPPSPSGFWVSDLPDRRRSTSRMMDGDVYEVQRFQRGFFPMAPGEYRIPPARLEFEVRRGLLYAPETREIESEPLPLVVLPVPAGAPAAFTGAVGSYSVRGELQPGTVPAGEAAVLTVVVEGEGNVKTLPPPTMPAPPGIDVFPPSEEADTEVFTDRVRGSKRFSWVLIPRESGTLEIPAVEYPYFDPESGSFEVATVPAMTLEVTPGSARADAPLPPRVRYLRTEPGPADAFGWVRSPWFAAAQSLPLLLLALGMAWGRARRDGVRPPSSRSLRRRRVTRLRELEEQAARGGSAFFGDADVFVREWLAQRLGADAATVGRPSTLAAAGVSDEAAAALRGLLNRLAAARYSPVPPGAEARRDIVRALGRLLERVDREAGRAGAGRSGAGRGGSGPSALILLALLSPLALITATAPAATAAPAPPATPTVAAVAAAAAAQGAGPHFQEGVRAFDEERYEEAAAAFDRYLELRPHDGSGWYNLGTAYYRAGHAGYAVWAWLQVPRLDPRNMDVRHNLRVVGVPPELVDRASPPLYLRASEILFLAALAWLVTGVAGAFWLARRRKGARNGAIVALTFALILGGVGWSSTRDPEILIVLEPVTLRAGPALRSDPVVQLEPGSGLRPIESRQDWVRVRTPRGDEGWVESNSTGKI